MRTLPAVLLVAAAAGCAGRGAKPAALPSLARSPARDTLLAVDLARSDSVQRLGLVDGVVAYADESIAYLRAGLPALYGRSALRAVLGMTRADQVHAFRWQPMGGGLSRDGRSGYSYGIAAVATSDGESRSDLVRLDRYIAFWRRQAPGPWRLVAYAEIGAPASPLTVDVGLVPPGQPVSGRTADLIGELRRTDLEFSDNASRAGIENAFASWAATDAVMFSGSEVVVGKDAIKELMRPTTSRSLAWRPVHAGVSGSGDLGFTVGEYVATGRSASGTVTQHFGKYLTVWRKEADGSWRFVVDGGNESPGQPAARSTGDR